MNTFLGFSAFALLLGACSVPALERITASRDDTPSDTSGGTSGDIPSTADAGGASDDVEETNPALDTACTPVVVIRLEDQGANGALFTQNVPDPEAFVQETGRMVCRTLYRKAEEVRAANKITLILKAYDGVAAKSGDVGDITVSISTTYLASAKSKGLDLETEIRGVLTHEMTHMYQNDDKAPGEGTYANLGGAIEGIADAVRMRLKFIPPGAKPKKTGVWDDEGYAKPAFFLLWVDNQYPDFVYRLNQTMAMGDGKVWTPASSFKMLTGKTDGELWKTYATAACCSEANQSCCK